MFLIYTKEFRIDFQNKSTQINPNQPESIWINPNQPESTWINQNQPEQPESTSGNPYQLRIIRVSYLLS